MFQVGYNTKLFYPNYAVGKKAELTKENYYLCPEENKKKKSWSLFYF